MTYSALVSFDVRPTRFGRPRPAGPYVWIGDFVRCHSGGCALNGRADRPIDPYHSAVPPLLDLHAGRADRHRLRTAARPAGGGQQRALAAGLRAEGYGTALVMPRTWKSAIAPAWPAFPTGRVCRRGAVRVDQRLRWGEKALPRMIDQLRRAGAAGRRASCRRLAGAAAPVSPRRKSPGWRQADGLGCRDPSSRWPRARSAPPNAGPTTPKPRALLIERGLDVWVVGGPGETALAQEIAAAGGPRVRDLTGADLRNGILAMAAAERR